MEKLKVKDPAVEAKLLKLYFCLLEISPSGPVFGNPFSQLCRTNRHEKVNSLMECSTKEAISGWQLS